MIYDFIGDIHGHVEKLKTLLKKLGYRKKGCAFAHIDSGRMAVFLGDFIDRGAAIRETLGIARNMVDSGAAHAAWDVSSIRALAGYPYDGRFISDGLLRAGTVTGSLEYDSPQALLKGIEIKLPEGVTFTDKDGNVRTKMRVQWWLKGRGKRYGERTFRRNEAIEDEYPDDDEVAKPAGYNDGVPVFFGHYWFSGQAPRVVGPKIACLDYSVASGGFTVA